MKKLLRMVLYGLGHMALKLVKMIAMFLGDLFLGLLYGLLEMVKAIAWFLLGLLVIAGWIFISYFIAGFFYDELTPRLILTLFMSLGGLAAVSGPRLWLTAGEAAQAEHTADRLAEKLRNDR
jgi:hypothetical protein